MNERSRARLVAYGVAVLAVAASLLTRAYVLQPVMDGKAVFLTFFPAVMIAAYFGGFRPGTLATVLSAVAADYFFIEPLYDVRIQTTEDLLSVAFFVLVGIFISGLCESLHRSKWRIAANERRYAVTLSSIGDAVIATNNQARVTFLNPVAEELTGWPLVDATGQSLSEVFRIVNEETRQPVEDPGAKVLRMGTVVGLANHTVLLARDGREIPIDDSGAPIIGDGGDITGVVLVFRDISERRGSDKRFRTFVDHATDAFFLFDDCNVVLDVNRQACESLGYTRDELLGMTPIDFDPDVTSTLLEEIQRKLDNGEMMAFESRHRRKDGTVFPVEVRGQAFWERGQRSYVSLARDITARKQTEEALRESEERFRGTFENAAVGIIHGDVQGRFLRVNQRYCDIVGFSREELLGMAIKDVTHPDDIAPTLEKFGRLIKGEISSYTEEKRDIRKDGSLIWIHISVSLQRDALGAPLHTIGILQDISQRKQLEAELRESEQRWRNLTEALPQLVWSARPDGACDYFSMQWTQHTGVPEDRLLGWQWMETLHPNDREPTRQLWTSSVAGHGPYDVEYRVRRTDGEYRWFKTRGVPIRDSEGRIVKWFGTCTDITDLRRTEEALRESEERFRGTFENAGVGIAHTDLTGRLLRVNEKFCDIVCRPRAELLRRTFQEITHPDDLTVSLGSLATLMRGESAVVGHEKRYLRKDGSPVWVELFTSLQRDAAGQPAYVIGVIQDISERRRLDAELRRAKEMAEAANRAKDEFLANVSHEIRTPMNAILGMTDLVLATSLSDDQRQSLKTVKAAADNLLGIINDLLDFSKIEAGKLELDPADFSLRAALGDTLRTLAMRAHKKGLELVSHVQPTVPDALVGDAGRLRQVLLNLVGNAIKFTDEGEVVIRVASGGGQGASENPESEYASSDFSSLAPRPSPLITLAFEVRDTGIGIPPEKQEKIFRAFEQEDTSTTRKYGGTGLGLTIAAQLVGLMGGKIRVDSEPSRGSTFTFTAKFGRQPHPPELVTARSPVQLYNLPVLVIDDNVTNCRILEEWLRSWQMEPVAVNDGVAAMDTLWEAVARGRPYPLVLLDARMPDTDGLVLAAKIRKRPELSTTRIILLTSGDMPSNLAHLRELQIDAHLLKPAQQDELLETIYRVMNRFPKAKDTGFDSSFVSLSPLLSKDKETRRQGGKETGFDSPLSSLSTSKPLHVLVAEDNDFNAQLLEQLLVRRGHRVQLASNGRKALSLLGFGGQKSEDRGQRSEVRDQKSEVSDQRSEVGNQNSEGAKGPSPSSSNLRPLPSDHRPLTSGYDLLLLDVHMPELDGFQVIQAIRENERSSGGHLPVIALTARSRKEDRERCLAAGMDDFLAKPIQVPDLWAAIDRVMSKDEGGRMKDEKEKTPPSDSSFILPASSFPRSSLLDARVLLAACGGDAVILEKICQAFRAGVPDHMKAVQDASREGDTVRLGEAAHKLCGMVSAFSTVAGGVASIIEDLAAQDQLEEARPLVEKLEIMAQELIQVVDGLSLETLQH